MRKILTFVALALLASTTTLAAGKKASSTQSNQTPKPVSGFALRSPDIDSNKQIGEKFVYSGLGCQGGNQSPALVWMDPPEGAKSFAVMVHDPDAPTGGSGWWHWIVINLPAKTVGLQQGAGGPDAQNLSIQKLPQEAVQIRTDFGVPGWGGPCPPSGDKPHHYVFTVYALGVEKLNIPAGAMPALVGYMVNANAIAKASLTAVYGRKK